MRHLYTLNLQGKITTLAFLLLGIGIGNGCTTTTRTPTRFVALPFGIKTGELQFHRWHKGMAGKDIAHATVFPQNAKYICPSLLLTFDEPTKAASLKLTTEWRGPGFSYFWGFSRKHTIRTLPIKIEPGVLSARYAVECPPSPPGRDAWPTGSYEVIVSISGQELTRGSFEVR